MPKIKGNHRYDADVFVDQDGFRYIRNKGYKSTWYLRCTLHPRCPGKAHGSKISDHVLRTREHNHDVDAYPSTVDLKNRLKTAASNAIGSTSNNEIFRQETRHDVNGSCISFPSIESSMQRAKRRTHPRQPNSPEDLVEIIENGGAPSFDQHFKGVATAQGSLDIALIFFSSLLTRILPTIKEINFDGTFYTVPSLFYQLFTILGFYKGHTIPLVHILMTSKSKTLYDQCIRKVKELLPEFKPTKGMGDYECASGQALVKHFPLLVVKGCQFHYCQSLWKKITKLGLTYLFSENRQFKKWVKKIMALPYIPADQLTTVADSLFAHILHYGIDQENMNKIDRLKAYFYDYWIAKVTPSKLSVFNFERGTNNDAESYHSRLKSVVRQHKPNIYTFLTHLNNIIDDSIVDVERLDNNLEITRKKKPVYVRNFDRRQAAKLKFSNNEYAVLDYLNAVTHTFDTCVSEFRLPVEEDSDAYDSEEDNQATPEAPLQQSNICGICAGGIEQTTALVPCGHTQYCGECIAILRALDDEDAKCPTCRTTITDVLQIYM